MKPARKNVHGTTVSRDGLTANHGIAASCNLMRILLDLPNDTVTVIVQEPRWNFGWRMIARATQSVGKSVRKPLWPMQKLASTIARELETARHCAVYEPELDRVWPDPENREKEIMEFAHKHGWRLRFYKDGLVAIFDKEPSPSERS